MNTKYRLTLGMGLLFLFVFLFFGIVIVNEKKEVIMLPKIEKKLNTYINSHYKNILQDVKVHKIKFKSDYFYIKVSNKKNKNLSFIVKYKQKKITSTYQRDYVEGKSLLLYSQQKLEKELPKSKTYTDIKISFSKKLNQYSDAVRESILINQDIKNLSIYNAHTNTTVDTFTSNEICSSIKGFYTYLDKSHFNPKTYSLVITNKNDISQAIEIKNLDKKIILSHLEEVIYGIMENDNKVIDQYHITYQYLN